jgi:hypothetical protein
MNVVTVAVLVAVGVTCGVCLRWRRRERTVRTEPDDREVCEARFVAKQLPKLISHRVKLLRRQRPDGAATLAGKKLPFAATDEGVETRAVPEVDVSRKSVLLKRFKVSVDRRDIELQGTGDVLGRHRSLGCEQRLKHESTRRRQPKAEGP